MAMYTISGLLFTDSNGNGVANGNLGLAMVSVLLKDSTGATVGTAVTDAQGRYAFANLGSGVYTVTVATPPGSVAERTTPLVIPLVDHSVTDQNFGFYTPATIAGFIFPDANNNGVLDGTEAPLDGVTVNLVDATGQIVATTTSAGNGFFAHGVYQFSNVKPGRYTVQALDAHSSMQVGSMPVALTSGQVLYGQSVGLTKPASVAGFVFQDVNNNGTLDAAEAPMDGVTVRLVDATGRVVATTVSAGNASFAHGVYAFDNVKAGTYTVQTVAPTGLVQSTALQVQLSPGQALVGQSVGLSKAASLAGVVYTDTNGNGVLDGSEALTNGVTVNLLDASGRVVASTVTAGNGFFASGVYEFDNLAAGTYTVQTVGPPGLVAAKTLQVQLAAGQVLLGQSVGLVKPARIAGLIFPDANGNGTMDATEAAVDGVTVNLVDATGKVVATTVSAANAFFPHGVYAFDRVSPGTYTVQAISKDGSGQVGSTTVSLAADQTLFGQSIGLTKGASVAGFVFADGNANGIADASDPFLDGVTVNLLDGPGHIVATTASAGNGYFAHGVYEFDNVKAGSYTVQALGPSSGLSAGTLNVQLAAGQFVGGQSVGLAVLPSVTGTVYGDTNRDGHLGTGEKGLAGVGVMLVQNAGTSTASVLATTTTDANGLYTFSGFGSGPYTVIAATPSGQIGTTPTSATVTASGSAKVDFGFAASPTPNAAPLPASTTINIVLRGQSNAFYFSNFGFFNQLQAAIQKNLGFDGTNQKINILGDQRTEYPSRGMIQDFLSPINGDYHNGWTAKDPELGILGAVADQSAAFRAAPTLVLWLHNESDSEVAGLTSDEWMSAARYEAGLLRAELGQSASTTPYLFVNAIPFIPSNIYSSPDFTVAGQPSAEQNIRIGMSALAADPVFNAKVVAQSSDVNMDRDGAGALRAHLDDADDSQLVARLARSIADTLSASALPGSPVALAGGHLGSAGPQVTAATSVTGHPEQLLLTVHQDNATGFQPLGSAAAAGLGWSIRHAASGTDSALEASGTAVQIADPTHLLVTFDKSVPTDGKLFYAWGSDRLATSATAPGLGNAIYDTNALPIWTDPNGVTPQFSSTSSATVFTATTHVTTLG